MNFIMLVILAFIFGFTYSFAVDLYEAIKTRVKRRREKKK